MKNYKIVYFPNKILTTVCKNVPLPLTNDPNVKNCISEMKNTFLNFDGFYKNSVLAISANQVGYDYNMFLILTDNKKKYFQRRKYIKVIINPSYEVNKDSKINIKWEGCLSDKDYMYLKKRYSLINVQYYNEKGEIVKENLNEMQSRIVQHEVDHLQGKEFYDDYIEKVELKVLASNEDHYDEWYAKEASKGYML